MGKLALGMVVVMTAERFQCERAGLWLTARCTQIFLVFFYKKTTQMPSIPEREWMHGLKLLGLQVLA